MNRRILNEFYKDWTVLACLIHKERLFPIAEALMANALPPSKAWLWMSLDLSFVLRLAICRIALYYKGE